MDINIQGPGVAAQHCYIENRSGVITLHPCGNLCAIDGLQATQPVRLSQGTDAVSANECPIIHSARSGRFLFFGSAHLPDVQSKSVRPDCSQQHWQQHCICLVWIFIFFLYRTTITGNQWPYPVISPADQRVWSRLSQRSIQQLSARSMKAQHQEPAGLLTKLHSELFSNSQSIEEQPEVSVLMS